MYRFRLYIAGRTPKHEKIIKDLRKLLEGTLGSRYSLQIIDVIEMPESASNDNIWVTPTLVKAFPPPLRKVIGDLTKWDKVLIGLALTGVDKRQK